MAIAGHDYKEDLAVLQLSVYADGVDYKLTFIPIKGIVLFWATDPFGGNESFQTISGIGTGNQIPETQKTNRKSCHS